MNHHQPATSTTMKHYRPKPSSQVLTNVKQEYLPATSHELFSPIPAGCCRWTPQAGIVSLAEKPNEPIRRLKWWRSWPHVQPEVDECIMVVGQAVNPPISWWLWANQRHKETIMVIPGVPFGAQGELTNSLIGVVSWPLMLMSDVYWRFLGG